MKWFPDGCSQEEAKAIYRRLARKWHPDMNPDNLEEAEANFKEIGTEYACIQKGYVAMEIPTAESVESRNCKITLAIQELVLEVYPKTQICYTYSVFGVTLDFLGKTPFRKMCSILEMLEPFTDMCSVDIEFHRPGRKKEYQLRHIGKQFLVDMKGVEMPAPTAWEPVKIGSIYVRHKAGNLQRIVNKKTMTFYIMKTSPKCDLWKLWDE